jgi:phosphoglycolate phosphatase-like HAD superfamily hydrolase
VVRSFTVLNGLGECVWRVAGRGGPDCSVLPPAPDLLTELMRGRAADSTVFVGATATDLTAGRAAGLTTYRYRRPADQEPAPRPWFEALSATRG